MKKLWASHRFREQQRIRDLDRGRRHRAAARREGVRPEETERRVLQRKDRFPAKQLSAPSVFSLIANPEESLSFLAEVHHYGKFRNVRIGMAQVTTLGPEAIACLLATIDRPDLRDRTRIRGDEPQDETVKRVLRQSGFFEHVRRIQASAQEQGGSPPVPCGLIRHSRDQVAPDVARDLSVFGAVSRGDANRKHGPSYTMLLEAMGNTFDHAAPRGKRRERWWASVYFDATRGRSCFTFIDHGVGILRSYTFVQRLRQVSLADLSSGHKVHRLLLGQVPSRTGEPHRGRGLPKAFEAWTLGRLKNLVVIANDAYVNAEQGRFTSIDAEFDGTILYWEI